MSDQLEAVAPQVLDWNYERLTVLSYQGKHTQQIEWRRDGDNAMGTFGAFEDATHFVHGYLDFWKAFRRRDTEESKRLRGRMVEEFLPTESMADQVAFPERPTEGTSVTITIPLAVLDTAKLIEIRAGQVRQGLGKKLPLPTPAKT